eukprot:UN32996
MSNLIQKAVQSLKITVNGEKKDDKKIINKNRQITNRRQPPKKLRTPKYSFYWMCHPR